MKILKYLILFFIITQSTFAQKNERISLSNLIVGKWINKSMKTKDGKEYLGTCKDTIQYLPSGEYKWNVCGTIESGKWKISTDNSKIIIYERNCKYWEDRSIPKGKKMEGLEIPIVSLSDSELVTMIYQEEDNESGQSEVRVFYYKASR